jgi:hypothetical protein
MILGELEGNGTHLLHLTDINALQSVRLSISSPLNLKCGETKKGQGRGVRGEGAGI